LIDVLKSMMKDISNNLDAYLEETEEISIEESDPEWSDDFKSEWA